MRKKVDSRIRTLVENGVKSGHRSVFVMVGDRGREQVVNLHYMLSKASVKVRACVGSAGAAAFRCLRAPYAPPPLSSFFLGARDEATGLVRCLSRRWRRESDEPADTVAGAGTENVSLPEAPPRCGM